ncbi:MAG: hypothetical protein ABI882_01675 [Acidobacteriota bacterium]
MKGILFCILGPSLFLVACSGPEGPRPAAPATSHATATPDRSGANNSTIAVAHGGGEGPTAKGSTGAVQGEAGTQTAGGLMWTLPRKWGIGPERPMRAATYKVPAADGDSDDGECAVFFFGPGQGGTVDANIDRWIGQFEQPDGRNSSERAKRQTQTVGGLSVTTVDLTGTYAGGMVGGGSGKKAGYRLLGAIIEGPQAAVFFKFTGPVKTVAAAEADFQGMLKSLKR